MAAIPAWSVVPEVAPCGATPRPASGRRRPEMQAANRGIAFGRASICVRQAASTATRDAIPSNVCLRGGPPGVSTRQSSVLSSGEANQRPPQRVWGTEKNRSYNLLRVCRNGAEPESAVPDCAR